MRLLIDVNVGRLVEGWLREYGYDIVAVRDIDPSMADSDILAMATQDERIVVTMDKDFGELVYRSSQAHAGVLLLRLETETSEAKIAILAHILSHFAEAMEGHFCVYQNGRLRVHKS